MNRVAAQVLMKVLYGARMARWDLLHTVCKLACWVTKRDEHREKQLYRLMCYIHSTLKRELVAWIAQDPHEQNQVTLSRGHLK